jgi:hypothetical protein
LPIPRFVPLAAGLLCILPVSRASTVADQNREEPPGEANTTHGPVADSTRRVAVLAIPAAAVAADPGGRVTIGVNRKYWTRFKAAIPRARESASIMTTRTTAAAALLQAANVILVTAPTASSPRPAIRRIAPMTPTTILCLGAQPGQRLVRQRHP